MFRKKATPWVMAVTMLGIIGTIEAQPIDENWVRQNANTRRQARTAIRYANTLVKMADIDMIADLENRAASFSKTMAPYKDAFLDAAEAVGAPHLDVVSDPTAPRTPKTCWETAAWATTGNHGLDFNRAAVQAIAERGLSPTGVIHGTERDIYVLNACINP